MALKHAVPWHHAECVFEVFDHVSRGVGWGGSGRSDGHGQVTDRQTVHGARRADLAQDAFMRNQRPASQAMKPAGKHA